MVRIEKSQLNFCLGALLLVMAVVVFVTGVRAAGEEWEGFSTIRQEVEQQAMEDALGAFRAGEYRRALITFEILSESAQSPDTARKALYALAVVKLILARSAEEYIDAVSAWERWGKRAPALLESEDPRMITPFLLRLEPAVREPTVPAKGAPPRKSPREIDFKGMLNSKAKEVENLRSKLDSREREIRRLRHQLESLEEIHRKYQEKKQGASQ